MAISDSEEASENSEETLKLLELIKSQIKDTRLEDACNNIANLLQLDPSCAEGWYLAAAMSYNTNNFKKATELIKRSLLESPDNIKYKILFVKILIATQKHRIAKTILEKIIDQTEEYPEILLLLGKIAMDSNELTDGYHLLSKYVELQPDDAAAHNDIGCILALTKNFEDSATCFSKAVTIEPDDVNYVNNYATALTNLGELTKAKSYLDESLKAKPDRYDTWANLGNIYKKQNDITNAINCFQHALKIFPEHTDSLNNLGLIYIDSNQLSDAIRLLKQASQLKPNNFKTQHNLGLAYYYNEELDKANFYFEKSISLAPRQWDNYYYKSQIQLYNGNLYDALDLLKTSIDLNPEHIQSLLEYARISKQLEQNNQARIAYRKILELDPHCSAAIADYAYILAKEYKWEEVNALSIRLENCITEKKNNKFSIDPLLAQALPISLNTYNIISKLEANRQSEGIIKLNTSHVSKNRIHVGYISSNFDNSHSGIILRDLFKYHNKRKFKVFAYSLVQHKRNHTTTCIKNSCEVWREFSNERAKDIATIIAEDNIDVLVDLSGYSTNSMHSIFSINPATANIGWMGYIGSLNSDAIEYYIADDTLINTEINEFHEKVLFLPNSCFATPPLGRLPNKAGKPNNIIADKFIFCCFSEPVKINQDTFDIWIKILKACPDSVLWIWQTSNESQQKLINYAVKYGLSSDRIIFKEKEALTNSWYHRFADLWLEPLLNSEPCSILLSLWAEVPVITKLGELAKSRVAASILKSIDLDKLITHSNDEYIDLAIEIYNNKSRIKEIKSFINKTKGTMSIFNPKLHAENLETIYTQIIDEKYNTMGIKNAAN